MAKIYKLGNSANSDNDFKYQDASISREHLEIEELANDRLLIRDVGSRNGTFIKENEKWVSVKQTTICKDDLIRIGHTAINAKKIFQSINILKNKDKVVFDTEFKNLEKYFKEYDSEKNKIQQNYTIVSYIIRYSIAALISGVVYFLGKKLGIKPELLGFVSFGSGILSVILLQHIYGKSILNSKLENCNSKYKDILVCPKCYRELISKSYKYWTNQGVCQGKNCQAVWVKQS